MASEPRDGIIRTAVAKVSGWFRTEDDTARESATEARAQKNQESQRQSSGRFTSPSDNPSLPSQIAQKVAILKQTLELSPNLKPRIEKEQSLRALLALTSEELLVRFCKLCEIGFLSPETSVILNLINEKVASVLSCRDDHLGVDPHEEISRLGKENLQLRQKIKALQSHYLRTGVITERELALEKEAEDLKKLTRAQQQQLMVARKKGEQLADWQEMVNSLKAKNGLLNSKVDYQVRLLRSLTAEQPKQRELITMMEQLTEQNSHLKRDLAEQVGELLKLKSTLGKGQAKVFKDLIEDSLQMHGDLEEQRLLLDEVERPDGTAGNLLERIERLTEDNANLSGLLEARNQFRHYVENPQQVVEGGIEEIVTRLKAENLRLAETIDERKEQLQFEAETPASASMLRICIRLRNEKRELVRENGLRTEACRQEAAEKQLLLIQLRKAAAYRKENVRLRACAEESARLAKILHKLVKQNELLKKERAELQLKHERATVELAKVNEKMMKISREYHALIAEYERLFGEQ